MLQSGIGGSFVLFLSVLASFLAGADAGLISGHNENSLQVVNVKRYFDYGSAMIRGVNLGGWFLLEPYITPSLFEAFRTNPNNDDGIPVDEYNFCKRLGKDAARERLTKHWSTFYTEQDFHDMKAAGLNMVRIPIGYWAFKQLPDDPYADGQEEYFDRAVEWARAAGLKVWVDLHGAPGSQNGFDNSGLRDQVKFLEPENIALFHDVIRYVFEKYSRDNYLDVIIGVQVLNEPLGPNVDIQGIRDLYYFAYDYLRNQLKRDQIMVIHDAFMPSGFWNSDLHIDKGYWGVVMDHHHYQVFSSGELSRSMEERVSVACAQGREPLSEAHWPVCGEWSAALDDCAKWLNGVGRGARWDGKFQSDFHGQCNEDYASWTEEKKTNTRKYIEAQLDAYEMRGGWIFWCWKTEALVEWDMNRLLYHGLFPQPLTDRKFPNQCGNH